MFSPLFCNFLYYIFIFYKSQEFFKNFLKNFLNYFIKNLHKQFTCFFGFLSIRICILIVYNIIEKINDNKRRIDNLNIDVYIKDQLKKHNILYVKDLCEKSRNDLNEYLNEEEIALIAHSENFFGATL